MGDSVSWELLLILAFFIGWQVILYLGSRNAASRAQSQMGKSISEASDAVSAIGATGSLPQATGQESEIIKTTVRSAMIKKTSLAVADATESVDFYFGEDLQLARIGVSRLPIMGLLATFFGMGFALWSSASAQGELNRTLSADGAPAAQVAGSGDAPAAAENFEADIGELRQQLKADMDHSTEGLRKFVGQQQKSLAGMGLAVAASIFGILFSLLLQRSLRHVEAARRRLVDGLIKLSEGIAVVSQRRGDDVENLSSDQLLKELIVELREFTSRAESTDTAANLAADHATRMLAEVSTMVADVRLLAAQSRATDDSAAKLLTSASQAVTALAPTAEAASTALRIVGKNVSDLQETIQAQVQELSKTTSLASDSVSQIESATSQTVAATNSLKQTVAEIQNTRDQFESRSTEVTGRVGRLIDDHKTINSPVANELRQVAGAMQKVETRMRQIEGIAADSQITLPKVIGAVVAAAAIAWAVGAYMRVDDNQKAVDEAVKSTEQRLADEAKSDRDGYLRGAGSGSGAP